MIGKTLGNRYEIVEKIGGGGMAIVYRAKCNLLNRYVAVKILRPEFTTDKDLLEKFRKESQAAASLSHPNIVNIYDVGEDDGIYYIVMEYVAGKTLKEVIKEKGHLSFDEIINYGSQIAYALSHAHNNHIVHRDIKPHNILVTADGRAKVTDFGIAVAATSSTITNAGSVIGSVHYFSPEQARGGYTNEKSDLYSLGIVLYEMATGRVPFEGESPITVALKQIQEEPIPPSQITPDIPKGLEDIIMKLMQKEQASRYQNTLDLTDSLRQLRLDPSKAIMQHNIHQEDSPTQIMPAIKEEIYNKTKRNKIEDNTPAGRSKNKPKEKKVNKWVVGLLVFGALLLALVLTFGVYYAGNWFRTVDVEVPKLVDMEIDEAIRLIEDLGLRLNVQERFDDEIPVNRIISQSPTHGMKVRKDTVIRVTVSMGSRLSTVPELINRNAIDARIILGDVGLNVGEVTEEPSELPIGVIIRQNPRAGLEVPEGSTVDYVVSSGPAIRQLLMPNLIGSNIDSGRRMIEQLGLVIGETKRDFSNEYAAGQIIYQSIPQGTYVEEGTILNLTVSIGPPPTEEEEDVQENDVNASTPVRTRYIDIVLDDYNGNVDIEIYQMTLVGKQRIYARRHNASNESSVRIPVEGSGRQTYEIFINGELISTLEINF